ncbi:hypothetical protein D7147_08775 [Micromonospora musae]|uniref:Uncharacterized protein n=1 Tax=Micromonospora musae TaxID=1894970 RepID=A0ABX9REF7_9ACTN|nr:hypothetical protein D7147_08775 [Micromonospora musae]
MLEQPGSATNWVTTGAGSAGRQGLPVDRADSYLLDWTNLRTTRGPTSERWAAILYTDKRASTRRLL